MKKLMILFAILMAFPCLAEKYIVPFSGGILDKYSNYPDVIINEICIHNVRYLVTDNGHVVVAVDQNNNPLVCKVKDKSKEK